jgi:hypothetical protein
MQHHPSVDSRAEGDKVGVSSAVDRCLRSGQTRESRMTDDPDAS